MRQFRRHPDMKWFPAIFVLATAVLFGAGCKQDKLDDARTVAKGLYSYDAAKAVHKIFSGEKAFAQVKAQVDFGPRPAGSPALEKLRGYLEEQLKSSGWETQRQNFEEYTPIGSIKFSNIRARFPAPNSNIWQRPAAVLIGSHFDTKLFRNFNFVGANDGASSTAVLLEMARVLQSRPEVAQFLELVFFDGEEAIVEYYPQPIPKDGLFGSRHYVEELRKEWKKGEAVPWPTAFLLLDMVGEKDIQVKIPKDRADNLAALLITAAEELGYSSSFSLGSTSILDDHIPFVNAKIPSIDIIDLEYPVWHTALDNLDQISPKSLEIVGRTTLLMIEKHLLGSK